MGKQTYEKILVYGDVHGNIDSLNKLRKTRDYKTATMKIFLGDAVMMGDSPRQCLEIILKETDVFLLGNHDSYAAFGLPKNMKPSSRKKEHQYFMRNQIPEELQKKVRALPKELYLSFCGKTLYFTHYLWEDAEDVEDELAGEELTIENLDKKFERIDADIIFHGHDHYPSHHKSEKKEYYIVGSLGMKKPAKYVTIIVKNNKLKIKHKTLRYNIKKVAEKMRKLNYPGASTYAEYFYN